jgi:hypothetical protein
VVIDDPRPAIVHPPLPAPLTLEDEAFTVSETGEFCLSAEEAEKMLRNKTGVLLWMEEANNLLRYYRSLE